MRYDVGRFRRPMRRSTEGQLMSLISLGDGSTLTLDFTTGVLDPRLTFTRASGSGFPVGTGPTYVGSDKLIKYATATNQPRFDHDFVTGSPNGLLIEQQVVNLVNYSNIQGGWLGGSTTTVTANTTDVLSPDGTNNASKITFGSTGYCSRFEAVSGLAASTAHTFSYWIRGTAGNQQRVYSVTAGTDLVTQTNLTYTNTGWTRVQVNFTTTAATSTVYVYVTSRPTGTTGDIHYVWGAQLETGTGANSLVPTGASQSTKASDECSIVSPNFSTWFNATEGTFLAHAIRNRTSDVGRIASANDNTANESIDIGASTTGQFIVTDGGSALATITPGTVTAKTAFKIAGAFKLNDVQAALGGTLGTPDTGVTMPTVNQLMIGRQAGASPVYLNGTVSLIKFWPTRLPNAQLQSLTT